MSFTGRHDRVGLQTEAIYAAHGKRKERNTVQCVHRVRIRVLLSGSHRLASSAMK